MAVRKAKSPWVSAAVRRGKAKAGAILEIRAKKRRKRARVIAARPVRRRAMAAAPVPRAIPKKTLAAIGPQATGVLIAEGDSWFDYPMNDVLEALEDNHGFDVESVAHAGDNVEDMAYSGGQFEQFARRLEKLLRQNRIPDAILISGGGNDLAGDEFVMLLNHAASGLPTLNDDVVRGIIDVRLANAYVFLISALTEMSKQYLNRPIPIVIHGYAYPVPDGRGVLGGWGILPGPWLRPGFHRKGHPDQNTNAKVMRKLIDTFNAMLERVSATQGFAHVRYLDLRNELASDSTYKKDWANEMHPTARGFAAVAAKFAAAIGQ
jgi:lysophospholipase L1-like esterase